MRSVIPQKVQPVIAAIADAGGRPLLVGGAVRDVLLNAGGTVKDLDFEVYHLDLADLIAILSRFGKVETVGSSFAVIKLFMSRELNIDFALPRRESKEGRGHRGFIVAADPEMPPEEACARRDFTINAMLMDPMDGTIYDFFNGRDDLRQRTLRHTSDHFDEDPLRPLRAMQFAARFDMRLAPETAALCRTLQDEAEGLAEERIFGEWEKWALLSRFPSKGLEVLRDMGWNRLFEDILGLADEDQGKRWAETLEAVDRAAAHAAEDALSRPDRLVLMFGALCHGLDVKAASRCLSRIGVPNIFRKRMTPLLEAILAPCPDDGWSDSALRRLSVRLAPESVRNFGELLSVIPGGPAVEAGASLVARAEALGVADMPPEPLVSGKMLIDKGVAPGPDMGRILKTAFEAQLNSEFSNLGEAEAWLSRELAKH